ncbi:hypothetical protein KFL_000990240 [Klebsormidium nitens]|uniref:Uncharacterized protein n=1 Tax=Klebsormidium nitens TaxID=105231 RepID=A0A1Y1HTX0_KLENI|nr:hypothetical protein KFL_000990240 [Klebsormidium nitens]|eukprot:GAQ82074.1 hypothetical protein KFL_000990240 [Klebsormidium nitens]
MAAKLKRFVKQQKGKLEKSAALHEWMVAHQQLQDECGAAERDAAQAQEAISEFLLDGGDQVEGSQSEGDSRELILKVRDLRQRVADKRRRSSTFETSSLTDELRRIREELEQHKEELEHQESACIAAGPSTFEDEPGNDEDVTWQSRLEELFSRFPTACDEKEKAESRRLFADLVENFLKKRSEFEATCPPSTHAGWSLEDHETFLRVRRAGLAEASATCQPQSEVVSRVCRMMPHRAQRDIVQHSEWYAERLLWRRKLEDLHASKSRQLDEALEKLERKLSKKEAGFRTAAATALDTIKREAVQSVLQSKLDNHRKIKADSAQLELQKRLEMAETETEKKQLEERRAKDEKAKAKALLENYRAEIEDLAREKEQEATKGRALREETTKAEAQLNAERVEFRRRAHAKKVDQLRRAAAASEAREREKEERLAKLRAQVAVQVEADKARVLQPTAAMLAAEAAAKESELFPVHGFTTEELMRDKRFRLGLVLREAGLHNTAAGRDALISAAPKPRKPDTLSQIRFAPENLPP